MKDTLHFLGLLFLWLPQEFRLHGLPVTCHSISFL